MIYLPKDYNWETHKQDLMGQVQEVDDGVLAVDLDGTLAEKMAGEFNRNKIGAVVPAEMERVLDALAMGRKVVIFTARASDPENIPPIRKWLEQRAEEYEYEPLGKLEITNVKSPTFSEIHDDRARQILPGGVMKSDAEVVAEVAKAFEEDQHPRDDHGRFTDGLDNSGVGAYVRSVGIKDAAEAEHGIRRTLQLIAETPDNEGGRTPETATSTAQVPSPTSPTLTLREADAIRGDIGALKEVLTAQGCASSIIPKLVNRDIPTWNIRGTVLKSPADVFAALFPIRSPYFESLKVAVLDKNNVVVHSQIVTVGCLNSSIAEPSGLFGVLNQVRESTGKNYTRIMIAHNHPSGDPTPSSADISITKKCGEVANALGFEVVDHVITNGKKWASMKELGLTETNWSTDKGPSSRIRHIPIAAPPADGLSPWERVERSELKDISQPDLLSPIVAGLRQGNPDAGHVFYLNGKNMLTGVERLDNFKYMDNQKILRQMTAGANREGANRVILDVSPYTDDSQAVGMVRMLAKRMETFGVDLVDGVRIDSDGSNFKSFKVMGLIDEKPSEYGVKKSDADIIKTFSKDQPRDEKGQWTHVATTSNDSHEAVIERGKMKADGPDVNRLTVRPIGGDSKDVYFLTDAQRPDLFASRTLDAAAIRHQSSHQKKESVERLTDVPKFPSMLPTIANTVKDKYPHIPLSVGSYHLIGTHDDYAIYESQNQRMGGKSLRVLHSDSGWLKDVADKTTAARMASRHADGLAGIPPDYSGKDGWGKTKTFNWKSPHENTVEKNMKTQLPIESVTFKRPLRKPRTVLLKIFNESDRFLSGRECDGDGVEFGPERTLEKRHVTLRKAIPIRYDLKTPSPVPQMTMPEQLKHLAGTAEDPTPHAQPDEFGRFPVDPTLRELKTPDRSTYEQGVDHAFKEEYIRNDVRGADQRKQDLPGT